MTLSGDPPPFEKMSTVDANAIDPAILATKPFFKKGGLMDEVLDMNGSDAAKTNRDQMLAESFPALTLPVGANKTGGLLATNSNDNYDMQTKFETNNSSGWPRDKQQWMHSDVKNVAFLYVFNLFEAIVNSGGLK